MALNFMLDVLRFMETETHKWTGYLRESYLILDEQQSARGFYDPGGIRKTLIVDPSVENPTQDEDPWQYARKEFNRGGSHDTPRAASVNFDDWLRQSFSLFEAELGKAMKSRLA